MDGERGALRAPLDSRNDFFSEGLSVSVLERFIHIEMMVRTEETCSVAARPSFCAKKIPTAGKSVINAVGMKLREREKDSRSHSEARSFL